MGSRRDRKLRNYLINNDLQLRVVLTILFHMLLVVVITVGVVLGPLIVDMFLSQDLEVQYRAAQTFITLIKRLIPAVFAILVLVFIHQVLITHRICGPLVNFTNTFKRVAEGDLTRKIFLRQGDYLREECKRINEMIDGLSNHIARIGNDHEKLVQLLEEILSRIDDPDTCLKIDETLEIVKREAKVVADDLETFKIEKELNRSDSPPKDAG